MGMDLSYQAIAHDSPALERARRGGPFGCDLEFWSSIVTGNSMLTKTATEMAAIARRAARAHLGLGARRWAWSRNYDAAHYLLSPARREGNSAGETLDWAHDAIYGTQVLHAEARTTIGFPIRYSSPTLVRAHAEMIASATRDDLARHFDAQKMERGGVYKYWGDPDGFENWMWPQFEAWRGFLISMLDFPDEGLLCCIS